MLILRSLSSSDSCNLRNCHFCKISNSHLTFVLILGMMSAGKFVSTRVQRALDTWLQKGGWKIEVFADAKPSLMQVPSGVDAKIVT